MNESSQLTKELKQLQLTNNSAYTDPLFISPSVHIPSIIQSYTSCPITFLMMMNYLFRRKDRTISTVWWDESWNIKVEFRFVCDALINLSKLYFNALDLIARSETECTKTAAQAILIYIKDLKTFMISGLLQHGTHMSSSSQRVDLEAWSFMCKEVSNITFSLKL